MENTITIPVEEYAELIAARHDIELLKRALGRMKYSADFIDMAKITLNILEANDAE